MQSPCGRTEHRKGGTKGGWHDQKADSQENIGQDGAGGAGRGQEEAAHVQDLSLI